MNLTSFFFIGILVLFTLENTNQKSSTSNLDLSNNTHFGDTLYVDPPTGLFDEDRELIISKIKQAKPGDIILFSPGTYRIGRLIDIDIPEITLLGHEEGTIIRGCEPDGFKEHAQSVIECGGFELIANSQTIKNFIFEYGWHGIYIGCCMPKNEEEFDSGLNIKTDSYGGHLIENNTFRYSPNGMRVTGVSSLPTKIINNIFIDNYHGLNINGSNVVVENNQFYSREPEKVPFDQETHNAIGVWPYYEGLPPHLVIEDENDCTNNYILNNYIENYGIGIQVYGKDPEELTNEDQCGDTIVQGNRTVNRQS